MARNYWLMKCEPAAYTVAKLARDGSTSWEGVRNYQARNFMRDTMKIGDAVSDPLVDPVAAVSCGIYAGQPVVDLDYPEDSEAGVDGNFIMTGSGKLIEVQMSAEGSVFSRDQMNNLLDLAEKGVSELVEKQLQAAK